MSKVSSIKFSAAIEERFVTLLGDIQEQYYDRGVKDGKKLGYAQGYTEGVEVGTEEGKKSAYTDALEEATEVVGNHALDRFIQIFNTIEGINQEEDPDTEDNSPAELEELVTPFLSEIDDTLTQELDVDGLTVIDGSAIAENTVILLVDEADNEAVNEDHEFGPSTAGHEVEETTSSEVSPNNVDPLSDTFKMSRIGSVTTVITESESD